MFPNFLLLARGQDGPAASEELCLQAGGEGAWPLFGSFAMVNSFPDFGGSAMATAHAPQGRYESSPLQLEQAFSAMAQLSMENSSSQFSKKVVNSSKK